MPYYFTLQYGIFIALGIHLVCNKYGSDTMHE